jgi:channel protein (hemolysin III family)
MHEIHAIPWCGLREPVATLSHWAGASLFAGLAIPLLNRCATWQRKLAVGVLIATTLQTLSVSGCYHFFDHGPWREFFLRADVACIFCMIAGSATAPHAILFRGAWRWVPLVGGWTVAVCGATFHLAVSDGLPGRLAIVLFLAYGWTCVATVVKLWQVRGWTFVAIPVASGLAYTVGACLLLFQQPMLIRGLIGPHEVWHLAVLVALSLTWAFVYRIAGENEAEAATILAFPVAAEAPAGSRRAA